MLWLKAVNPAQNVCAMQWDDCNSPSDAAGGDTRVAEYYSLSNTTRWNCSYTVNMIGLKTISADMQEQNIVLHWKENYSIGTSLMFIVVFYALIAFMSANSDLFWSVLYR